MEHFFKRWFWTVNVLAVALVGIFAARAVSALAAAGLATPPSTTPTEHTVHPVVRNVTATVDAKALAALFGITIEDPNAKTDKDKVPDVAPGTEVPSTLNATLVATIEATPEEYSLAVITDNTTRDTAVYGIGDALMGTATLMKVERRRVLVDNNGRTEVLEMDADKNKGQMVASASPFIHTASAYRRTPRSSDSGGVKEVSDNNYVVSQQEIENTLSNLNSIATQARIVPAFKNGVAEGFKLFSIRPGSIYSKIGIQNGDVIKRINGFEINSPDKALEVYQKLRTARNIQVQLERRGQTITKSYSIQ